MPTEMFPRVKLNRTSTTKKFVAGNGERIKDLGEKTIPFIYHSCPRKVCTGAYNSGVRTL